LTVQRVRTSQHGWGTRVELIAPERRNALDERAVADLTAAFRTDGAGAVLLCAQGPVFCSGGDLEVLSRAAREGRLVDLLVTAAAAFADLVEAIVACPRPVVVAIDGPAVGGGACLALAGDVRLATPRAVLDLAWERHGLPPDGGASALLAAAAGPERAGRLLAESARLTTESDLAPLLFTRIVPEDQLPAESAAAVRQVAKRPDATALLDELRRQRDAELAALVAAAADEVTSERLAVIYKIDR
jgi:enoyl-CoA hydratase/carnithine racemase